MMNRLFRQRNEQPVDNQSVPYLLVGLGNPGREYRENRHNAGFMVIDKLCKETGISLSRMQSKALVGVGTIEGKRVVLAKPQTFMNLSGQAVGGLVRFYKIPLEQVLVIYDDLDLPFGTIRLRPGGGAGGQKGVASVIQHLGTQDFARIRVGIGRPPGQRDASGYVLQDFSASEQKILDEILDRAAAAARVFVAEGLDIAMNQYNGTLLEK
ncbi:MAG: aminoacyl-tRNA hydrolase [Chloroflexi bacterium]|nr:aminoacyl-tRNA hydrolase [Chloroflexota bacterium]